MGIEAYIASREPSTPRAVLQSPLREGPSRVFSHAQELIDEGVEGLGVINRRLVATGPYSLYTGQSLLDRNPVVARNLRLDQAGIIMGITLQEVDRILEDESETSTFSELDFLARYSGIVQDSPLALKLAPATLAPVPLDSAKKQKMIELAFEDPTLSTLFAAVNFDALPEGLQRLLLESGTLDEIRGLIAPVYREKLKRAA